MVEQPLSQKILDFFAEIYLDEEKALCEMLCVKLGYLIENNIINDINETIIKLEKEIKESGFVEFLKIKDYFISKLYN